MHKKKYADRAIEYANNVVKGDIVASDGVINACKRFLADLERDDLEFRTQQADTAVAIIEGIFVHRQGEDMNGKPLSNAPFLLEPWQIFIVYNLLGFWKKGTNERRYKEAFIMIGRKNGKTSLIAALAFAMAIIQRQSGSRTYVVAAALKQALETFNFIKYSLDYRGMSKTMNIHNNSFEHSIKYTFTKNGVPDGFMDIQIMASNPDKQDSFNCNFAIADEVAAFKTPAQYNRFKEAMQAYTNKLMIGITTAGDNINSFGHSRMEYALKVADGSMTDDSYFSFVAKADEDEKGDVDYLNPIQHMKANPNYGVTIRPEEIMAAARQAQSDPMLLKDFLSRSLNVYSQSMKAWFDLNEFKSSDGQYTWTIEELSKLPIDWYGGADLSRVYDLTAAALVGQYKGVDIIITHAFIPVSQINEKIEKDMVDVYGWEREGLLTICNAPTIQAQDVVNWFVMMRSKGFKIRSVGHDKKFAGEEYFPAMKKAHFSIVDQPQLYFLKSQGFRHIEKAAKNGTLYYLHSPAYEYCVGNVRAKEGVDDAVMYEKISEHTKIDLFDASVFATIRMCKDDEKKKKARSWFGEET